ncbi:MAG TPA: hypothetical protein VI322_05585, partial [Candidatus Saccharimonadia bacterium]
MRTPLQPNVEQQSPPVDQAEMFTVRFDTLEDDDDTEYAHDDDTELDHDDETAADSELDPDTEYADYTDYAETEPGPYTSSFELTEDGRWVDHNLEAPEGEELESNELLTHDPEKFELVTSLQDGESIDFESYGEDLNGRPVIFRTVYARVGSRIEVSFPEPEPYNPADLEIDEFGADDDMFAFPDAVPTTALPDLSELYNPATAEVGPAPAFEPALDLTWAALAELAASGGPTAPPAATTPQPNAAEIPEPTPWLPDLPTDAPTEMVTVIAKPKATSLFDTGEGWNVFDADPATPQPEPSPKPAPETVPSIEPVSATAELPANEPSIVPELSGVLEPASVPSPESASGPIILNASQTAQIRPLVPVPAPSTEPSTELSIGPRASAATAPTERPGGGGGGGGRAVAEPAVTKPAEPKATESTPAKPESTLAEPKSTPAESRSADTAVTAASNPAEAAPAT